MLVHHVCARLQELGRYYLDNMLGYRAGTLLVQIGARLQEIKVALTIRFV